MKKLQSLIAALLLTSAIAVAQYQQINTAPLAKQEKQIVKQKPYYGPEETLLGKFWENNPRLSFNVEKATDIPSELGYVFTASKNGVVTQLGVRMPRETPAGPVVSYFVSLWDYDTKQIIKRCQVDVTDIRLTFKTLDEEIHIAAHKKYVISVFVKPINSTQTQWLYYTMIKPGGYNSAVNFIPFTQGNLTFVNTQFTSSTSPAFPGTTGYHLDIASGLCDLVFKATEK